MASRFALDLGFLCVDSRASRSIWAFYRPLIQLYILFQCAVTQPPTATRRGYPPAPSALLQRCSVTGWRGSGWWIWVATAGQAATRRHPRLPTPSLGSVVALQCDGVARVADGGHGWKQRVTQPPAATRGYPPRPSALLQQCNATGVAGSGWWPWVETTGHAATRRHPSPPVATRATRGYPPPPSVLLKRCSTTGWRG